MTMQPHRISHTGAVACPALDVWVSLWSTGIFIGKSPLIYCQMHYLSLQALQSLGIWLHFYHWRWPCTLFKSGTWVQWYFLHLLYEFHHPALASLSVKVCWYLATCEICLFQLSRVLGYGQSYTIEVDHAATSNQAHRCSGTSCTSCVSFIIQHWHLHRYMSIDILPKAKSILSGSPETLDMVGLLTLKMTMQPLQIRHTGAVVCPSLSVCVSSSSTGMFRGKSPFICYQMRNLSLLALHSLFDTVKHLLMKTTI